MHLRILYLTALAYLTVIQLSCEARNGTRRKKKENRREPGLQAGHPLTFHAVDGEATAATADDGSDVASPSSLGETTDVEIVTQTYELQVEEKSGGFCSYKHLMMIADRLWISQWGDSFSTPTSSFDYGGPTILSQVIMHDEYQIEYGGRALAPKRARDRAGKWAKQNATEAIKKMKRMIPNETHAYRYAAKIAFPVPRKNHTTDGRNLEWSEYGADYDYRGWSEFGAWGEHDYGGGWWDPLTKTSIDVSLLSDFSCLGTAPLAWLVPISSQTELTSTPTVEESSTTTAATNYDYSDDVGFSVSFIGSDSNVAGVFCSHKEIFAVGDMLLDTFASSDWFGDSAWLDYVWPVEQDITRVERSTTTSGQGNKRGQNRPGRTTYVDQLTVFYQGLFCMNNNDSDGSQRQRKLTEMSPLPSGDLSAAINFEISKLVESKGYECLEGTTSVEVQIMTPDRATS